MKSECIMRVIVRDATRAQARIIREITHHSYERVGLQLARGRVL